MLFRDSAVFYPAGTAHRHRHNRDPRRDASASHQQCPRKSKCYCLCFQPETNPAGADRLCRRQPGIFSRALFKAGSSSPARMATMAMTMSNSSKVKYPRIREKHDVVFLISILIPDSIATLLSVLFPIPIVVRIPVRIAFAERIGQKRILPVNIVDLADMSVGPRDIASAGMPRIGLPGNPAV